MKIDKDGTDLREVNMNIYVYREWRAIICFRWQHAFPEQHCVANHIVANVHYNINYMLSTGK